MLYQHFPKSQSLRSYSYRRLGIIHRPNVSSKHDVSGTGICLRPQVKPTLLGSVERSSVLSPDLH
jgi:hypothetical protein